MNICHVEINSLHDKYYKWRQYDEEVKRIIYHKFWSCFQKT